MDPASLVAQMIVTACNKYQKFQSLKEENENFRKSMLAVRSVLVSIQESEHLVCTTPIQEGLDLITQAVKTGQEVMEMCSKRQKLQVSLFSDVYIAKLNTAGDKMNRGLSMISASGVIVQADIQNKVENAKCTIDAMQRKLDSQPNEIAELFLDIVMPGIERIPDEIVTKLRDMHVVASKQDCLDQIREIQQDPHHFCAEKDELCNEQLLQWALKVSLPPQSHPPRTDEIQDMLICPITQDFMRDPVILVKSGHTLDRESLCMCLLNKPTRCPVTNQDFGEKLQYIDSFIARKLLTLYLGDDAYQRYDDSDFERQYEALFAEPSSGNDTNNLTTSIYEEVAGLLYGLNQSQIDYEAAQQLTMNGNQEDAVVVGFKALLLHPESFDTGKLNTDEDESLCIWTIAEDLGLSAEVVSGNVWAQWLKGKFCFNVMDYDSARHHHELAASQGHALAQCDLGILYDNGHGVERDYENAREYYELAAAQGHATAQNNLGELYYNGSGVNCDYTKAKVYYEQAAAQGNAEAQNNLSSLENNGSGVDCEYARAREFYEQAAAQGNAWAQCNLGVLYNNGLGVKRDYTKAKECYELAAAQGNAEAQLNLGILYYQGRGVDCDYKMARHYYEQAAVQGDADAQAWLDQMSPETRFRPWQRTQRK